MQKRLRTSATPQCSPDIIFMRRSLEVILEASICSSGFMVRSLDGEPRKVHPDSEVVKSINPVNREVGCSELNNRLVTEH